MEMKENMINDFYQNIGLKGFFERYGIINALKRGLFIANPIHIVKDKELKKILWQKKASKKIQYYIKYKEIPPKGLIFCSKETSEPIWIYWNSGMDNAPEIVKKCYESVIKHSDKKVVLLTEKNIDQFIIFPDYILKKVANKQISIAAYSDLMRFALLEHYGGTWIDATIYLSGKIPDRIYKSDFFIFRNALGLLENPVLYPAWFLHTKRGNNTIQRIRNIAFAYWSKENHVNEYLLPNIIITTVIKADSNVEKTIPYMDSDYSEYLNKVLADNYNYENVEWIKKLTCIHKLTYKFDQKIDKAGSIYRHIINNDF